MLKSYVDALVIRVINDHELSSGHRTTAAIRRVVEKHATDILGEIQHRIYQDAIANLTDLARDINPKGEHP